VKVLKGGQQWLIYAKLPFIWVIQITLVNWIQVSWNSSTRSTRESRRIHKENTSLYPKYLNYTPMKTTLFSFDIWEFYLCAIRN
jgi:hypothetical protein